MPRSAFIEDMLHDMLKQAFKPSLIDIMMRRWDAVLEFTTFVVRSFLIGNFSIERHSSDVFDQFQLRYLAMDRFIIVTNDVDLTKRTAHSLQAERILSFQQFLSRL
jgi:hypothetical protein